MNYICDKEREYLKLIKIATSNNDRESVKTSLKYLTVVQDIKRYILSLLENKN